MASLGSCSICFESLAEGSPPISRCSPCGHVAHKDCIRLWEEQQRRVNQDLGNTDVLCPFCKQPAEKFEPLFVEVVKSNYMKELEKERASLQKELEESQESHEDTKALLHDSLGELDRTRKLLQEAEAMNRKLVSMDPSVQSIVEIYCNFLKTTNTKVNIASIFAPIEDKVGGKLTAAVKQQIREIVLAQIPELISDSSSRQLEERMDVDRDLGEEVEPPARKPNSGPYQIVVENCGVPGVNGTYHQDGHYESACKYTRIGRWKNVNYKFFIFQCLVSNNTRHWYISTVPTDGYPGTSADIDFYTAPVNSECMRIPPVNGWVKEPEGVDPTPTMRFVERRDGLEDTS